MKSQDLLNNFLIAILLLFIGLILWLGYEINHENKCHRILQEELDSWLSVADLQVSDTPGVYSLVGVHYYGISGTVYESSDFYPPALWIKEMRKLGFRHVRDEKQLIFQRIFKIHHSGE